MATVTTTHHIEARIHGEGIAASSAQPTITAKFDITFSRTDGASTVSWAVSGMENSTGTNATYFGYYFKSYIGINGQAPIDANKIIYKNNTTTSGWWAVTDKYNPSGSFTSTSNSTVIRIYIKCKDSCKSNGHWCFDNGLEYYEVFTQTVSIPTYETFYTVSYNANGGTGAPAAQTKSSLSNLTLSSQRPTYPLTVEYYNGSGGSLSNTVVINKAFSNWKGSDNVTYNPGGTYSTNAACTMTAQWGFASLTPIAIPDKYITVTFNTNEGSISPTSMTAKRTKVGYDTSSGATTPSYQPGTTYNNINSNLSLYPIYGNASLALSSIPTPTKSGYTFAGWYYDSALTNKVVTAVTSNQNITIYAKWTQNFIHKYTANGTWEGLGQCAWRYVDGAWHKIAHIYKYDGTKWIDTIPSPQPADVFNHGSTVGLNSYYSDYVEIHQESPIVVSTSTIYRGSNRGNSVLTLGGLCERGQYRYLCCRCKVTDGANGYWNLSSIGLFLARKGKGSSTNWQPPVRVYFTDCQTSSNYDGSTPWYNLPEQVVKLDLFTYPAESFYIGMHSCDCKPTISSIWFE